MNLQIIPHLQMPHDLTIFVTPKKKLVHNIYNYCECTPYAYLKRRHKMILEMPWIIAFAIEKKLINHLQIFKFYHILTLKETHISLEVPWAYHIYKFLKTYRPSTMYRMYHICNFFLKTLTIWRVPKSKGVTRAYICNFHKMYYMFKCLLCH